MLLIVAVPIISQINTVKYLYSSSCVTVCVCACVYTVQPDMRQSVSAFVAHVHKKVNDVSQTYLTNERRYNYTTPKSFLEQIKLYEVKSYPVIDAVSIFADYSGFCRFDACKQFVWHGFSAVVIMLSIVRVISVKSSERHCRWHVRDWYGGKYRPKYSMLHSLTTTTTMMIMTTTTTTTTITTTTTSGNDHVHYDHYHYH